jgi:hypothetical protein
MTGLSVHEDAPVHKDAQADPLGGLRAPDTGPRRITPDRLRAAAIAAQRSGALDRAFTAWRAYLRLQPEDAGAWSNLGALLRARGDHAAAVVCQRRANEARPGNPAILNNLGNALQDADMPDEALEIRRRVRGLAPDRPEPVAMLAVTLRSLNRAKEAAQIATTGAARFPDFADLRFQQALSLLTLGDYEKGFERYGARWETGEISRPEAPAPWWTGQDIAGQHLLVLPEQGFGDAMLMTRMLPKLKAQTGAKVLLAVKPPLLRLFRNLPGVDAVIPADGPFPEVDVAVTMMDLPRLAKLRSDAIPPTPDFHIPADCVGRAARVSRPFSARLKVGVMWAGSTSFKGDHKRSVASARFMPLAAIPGVQLFSLYKGPLLDRFRSSADSAVMLDTSGDDRDFADCAAMIRNLDLVISVDSAAAHLSACLGTETWNLLAYAPYWIYGEAGDTTPWHPAMRLVRQTAPGDWDGVFTRIAAMLRDRAADHAARSHGAQARGPAA